MFKRIGNAIYKTPWWALLLGGLFVFLLLALFTVPFNVIRLTDAGANRAEQQAIQREIDNTFGDSALSVAERVVRAMGERTTDPIRKEELDRALREITEARKEMFNAAREAKRAVSEADREAAREARRIAKEAVSVARAAAKEAAIESRDAARSKIDELRAARKEAQAAQARVGINDDAALASFDKMIVTAQATEKAAVDALAALKSNKSSSPAISGAAPEVGGPSSASQDRKPSPEPKKGATVTKPSSAKSVDDPDALNFDIGTKDARVKGSVTLGPDGVPTINVDTSGVAPPTPPAPPVAAAPPLPPELREDIRRKVTSDFRRVGIGSALILAFIPLFILLLIAKIYIGRSRLAQEVATEKTKEAESANLNRQIVEAKLMALQAQVEPHFLYNTLANVQALTEVDPVQANQMTGHLIQYLRAALPKMRENISTVGQEVELVRAYLNILKMRMGDRLAFDIDVPETLLALPFPPLMLPSLVENAIKHGLEPLREGGRIDVAAEKIGEGDAASIRLYVKDTGRGFSDEPIQTGGGVGLANIRERLLALFGDRAHLTLEANTPKGVIASIETPANGASALSPPGPTPANVAAQPKSWGAKTLNVAARTHNFWASLLAKTFVAIIALLGVLFGVAVIGMLTGTLPMTIFGAQISGVEGMAFGTVVLVLAFGLLSIVALVVVALIYGLGFLFLAVAIGIPIVILISLFPALAPFAFVAFLVYWFWWRKRTKAIIINPPKA